MVKSSKPAKDPLAESPSWTFKIKGKKYLVFTKDDDLKVTLDGEVVFDKFQSALSYIEWIKTVNK